MGTLMILHFFSGSGPTAGSLALAFGAGVLATLNPCGFALLPAYVSYSVEQQVATSTDHAISSWQHLLRGGILGLPLTAGFLLIFLVVGGILALGGRLLVHVFPWLAILVGIGLILLGCWMLFTGRTLEMPGFSMWAAAIHTAKSAEGGTEAIQRRTMTYAIRAALLFGVGYGLSSLGCTLPVFLLVIGTAITTRGWSGAIFVLASYAIGMALVLLLVTFTATTLSNLLRATVFPFLRWIQPVAALLLVVAGSYIVFYQVHAGLW